MPASNFGPALVALALPLAVVGCGLRHGTGSGTDEAPAGSTTTATTTTATAAALPATLGMACKGDDDCGDGLRCVTTFTQDCNGPGAPHVFTLEFPGGSCTATRVRAPYTTKVTCPAGAALVSVIMACDGQMLDFCARPCAADADCRAAEGYRCEGGSECMPPALVSGGVDAGSN
jgi:hypothetical protein